MTVRVLVVDDSAVVRRMLSRGLNRDPGIEVVGTASDAYEARDRIVELRPDVMTLDVHMPRMDGIEFLRRLLPQYSLPVVVVSTLTKAGAAETFAALDAGAIDFVEKPSKGGFETMVTTLCRKVRDAAKVRFPQARLRAATHTPDPAPVRSTGTMIAIGSSTGGVEALRTVLTGFPASVPGIVIVQHMPSSFTGPFARRLDQLCPFEVKEAAHGDTIEAGRCLLAPGDQQLEVVRQNRQFRIRLFDGPKVDGHRPSVTVMMLSVATNVGKKASGAILTGMGRDGADGLLAMRRAGAHTVVQDEETSVVYGMPKAAFECGAARHQVPLHRIAPSLLSVFRR